MAAKVVMVAVPAVLGIASVRVYTVREASADGLITREKLNIYNPLPQSAQVPFVSERPGVIESGLTTVRQSILPFVRAVEGACISLKMRSVNLYYAGEDLYYYLKDPPPGFLPRFGTITMAGLFGMVLARKGSRFKQLAVPLGLIGAGASVCYPAQAVSALKVTGKNVYAAGQWTSVAVTSLLTTKPQDPASQPQTATVPNPEFAVVKEASESSSAQSTTISEPEFESAESVPFSDEQVFAVITEEPSSVTLTDVSLDQAPTERNTDPSLDSVTSEAEDTTSDEPHVESKKPSDTKQAPGEESLEASPAESPSFEPDASACAPADSAPKASDEPAVPVVESAEPEPANRPPVAAAEETPPADQPATENSHGGSGFKPDPSLLDFGQSSPEDEDLYSTRS